MIIEISTTGSVIVALVLVINTLFSLWGMLDVYAMLRFRKKAKGFVDSSAIMGNWINLKWMFASRWKEMVVKHPWLSQDLSEVLGEKEDDGKVT